MKAKHIFIMMILVFGIVSCTPKFIKNYEKSMIENPSTQAEKDQNVILQYLADNKLDFKSTESGIYYSIDNEGDGEGNPTTSDLVKTHYKG
ncbi:MAG: hypothetical protein ACPG5P_04430, partial [Saprospiraceae bacterium]